MIHTNLILCIDDDEDDLEMLATSFNQHVPEFEIITCNSGESGLEKLVSLKNHNIVPNLIVLDINMPRMDGRETLHQIRAVREWASIPVVIFSTSSSPIDQTYFKERGVAYLIKPVDMDKFQEAVQHLLSYCK